MKQIEMLSTNFDKLDNQRHARTYLNKKVYSKDGNVVGWVKDLLFSKNTLSGFLVVGRRKLFIDKEYIGSESEKTLMLSMNPILYNIGKKVFDSDGRKVGKVVGLDRKSKANSFQSLIVKAHIFSKPFPIPKEHIEVCKENVILNRAYPK